MAEILGDATAVDWTLPQRLPHKRWWHPMTLRLRAVAGDPGQRPAPITIGVLITIVIYLVSQLIVSVFWAGHMSGIVEYHGKVLDSANVGKMQSDLDALKVRYSEQEQWLGAMVLYESKLREIMVSSGHFRPQDLPPMPERPQR